MRKQTVSSILTGIIVCLVVAIVVLIVKIGMRGPKVETDLSLSSNDVVDDIVDVATSSGNDVIEIEPELVASPNTSTSVNVRSGPGTEFERIGSAYATGEYKVIEILGSGWTKIDYDGEDGYISSEYLKFQYRQDLGDGSYTYYDANIDGSVSSSDDQATDGTAGETATDEQVDNDEADGADGDDPATMIR